MGRLLGIVALLVTLGAPVAARAQDQVPDRVEVVQIESSALGTTTPVRVLLPEGYDPSGATRYPVLYILHGASGNSTRWLALGGAREATAGHDLIVVMPEGGLFGFYTDWFNGGAGGAPRWESYHLGELIPWIDAHYPTIANRDGRAIAGESMGGLGAMHYAATRPDLFTSATAFSGAIDTNNLLAPPIIELTVMVEGRHLPAAAFGPRLTEEVRYRGHNPIDLAENLRGLLLQLDTGDGHAGGPLGPLGPLGAPTDPVEAVMLQMNQHMHDRLDALGIEHGWNPHPGCHCWPQWADDLERLVPRLMDRFAHPVPAPSPFAYTSIKADYGVYDWTVAIDRPAVEFSRLFDAGPAGFGLTGSGQAVVTTAPLFDPGQAVATTIDGATTTLIAGGDGRLTVPVSLGPGNRQQQYSPLGNLVALGNGGEWPSVTTRVSFAPVTEPAPAPTTTTSASSAPASAGTAIEAAAAPARSLPTTGGATDPSVLLAVAALALVVAVRLRQTAR